MGGNVLGVEATLIHQGLHIRVIARYLGQLAVAQAIAAGVTHVAHAELGAVEHHRGKRGAHALGLWMLLDVCGNGRVCILRRGAQQREHVIVFGVLVEVLQVLNHELGGHLAGGVAAHSVCQ